jgi:hypothetical protein
MGQGPVALMQTPAAAVPGPGSNPPKSPPATLKNGSSMQCARQCVALCSGNGLDFFCELRVRHP